MARAILDDTPVPTPIEDAVANMNVIEAIRQSAEEKGWVELPASPSLDGLLIRWHTKD